jgi:hypothetical protein
MMTDDEERTVDCVAVVGIPPLTDTQRAVLCRVFCDDEGAP